MAVQHSANAGARVAPADAAAFVAEAERITNERDVVAIDAVFAPTATQTVVVDGLVITARNRDEIRAGWSAMCAFMRARGLTVSKRLVSVDDQTIVNEWRGNGARANARGIECWRFGAGGLVVEQRLYGFLNAGPDTSPRQQLRLLLAYPITAVTFAMARLRAARSDGRSSS